MKSLRGIVLHTGGFMKDDGFTIIEMLISLSLMVVFSMSIFVFFKSVNTGVTAVVADMKKAHIILKTDDSFRQIVSAVTIPYWDNNASYMSTLYRDLALIDSYGVIQSVSPVRRNGLVAGVVIMCMYDNEKFEVSESFKSVSIMGIQDE